MPTDPNARGNSILSDILKAMNKQNDLLVAQNKILDKMEKHARPKVIEAHYPYLERSSDADRRAASGGEGSGGIEIEVPGGPTGPPGTSLDSGLPGVQGR